MNLNLVNDLINNLKERKFVQDFINELTNSIEKNNNLNYEWNDINSEDLILYDKKIINKYRDEILLQRFKILSDYAEKTKQLGEMYYIYAINEKDRNSFNLCFCKEGKSHEVVTILQEKLPEKSNLGNVLRKQCEEFKLDINSTKVVNEKINSMIQEKIKEQNNYLESKRIEGHIYEASEKYSGRIWLYDLNNNVSGMEGIEEIDFPKNLYEMANEGDLFIYKDGEYRYYKSN